MGSRRREYVDGLWASTSAFCCSSAAGVWIEPEPREVVVRHHHTYAPPPTWECQYCGSSQTFEHEKCIGCGCPMVKPKEETPKGPTMHAPPTEAEIARMEQPRKRNWLGRPKAWRAICEHCGTLLTKLPGSSKCKSCGGRVISYRDPITMKGDRK